MAIADPYDAGLTSTFRLQGNVRTLSGVLLFFERQIKICLGAKSFNLGNSTGS